VNRIFEPITAPLRYMPISRSSAADPLVRHLRSGEGRVPVPRRLRLPAAVVVTAIRAVPEELVRPRWTLGASRWQVVRTVLLRRAARDLRFVPRHERDLVDVRGSWPRP